MLVKRTEGWNVRHYLNISLLLAAGLLLAGCSTIPNRYIPSEVGSLNDADDSNILRISIDSENPELSIGEPIVFQVSIKNISKLPLWVPRDPAFFFTWIYPDGRHDSFVYEPQRDQFYTKADSVCLRPGQQITKSVSIRTYYFERKGVTEFRAYLRTGRNTNPSLMPFWNGELASNSYGIMLGVKKKGYIPGSLTKSVTPRTPAS
jgi:hypothetical protein